MRLSQVEESGVLIRRIVAVAALVAAPVAAPAQVLAIMYHAHPNLGYTPEDFRDHLDFFAANQFSTIDMDQFYAWHQNDAVLPYRPVLITVDDNYLQGYTEMYPMLAERGMVAINFTHTRGIGVGIPKASWSQVIEMDSAGVFLLESHSQTHPQLDTIGATQLFNEIHGSRDDIFLNGNGKVTRHFCYPYGRYNQAVIAEVQAAGYLTAITTRIGLNYRETPLYELERFGGDGRSISSLRTHIGFANYPPPPPGEGWLLDDVDPNTYYNLANWAPSTSEAGFIGQRYRVRSASSDPNAPTFRWAATLPQMGQMTVHARWTSHPNRASNARYTILTANGPFEIIVDQRSQGSQWVTLGTYDFGDAGPVDVRLGGPSDGFLVADAIWFEPASPTSMDAWLVY
jgi:peptidoglycan/xylan/chitin deacetylase (PgdA/CDA1 family)